MSRQVRLFGVRLFNEVAGRCDCSKRRCDMYNGCPLNISGLRRCAHWNVRWGSKVYVVIRVGSIRFFESFDLAHLPLLLLDEVSTDVSLVTYAVVSSLLWTCPASDLRSCSVAAIDTSPDSPCILLPDEDMRRRVSSGMATRSYRKPLLFAISPFADGLPRDLRTTRLFIPFKEILPVLAWKLACGEITSRLSWIGVCRHTWWNNWSLRCGRVRIIGSVH